MAEVHRATKASSRKSKSHPCVGMELCSGWKVGPVLGQGAQGTVHAVMAQDNKTEMEWVVKMTAKPTHMKSKSQASARLNSSSLHNEGLLYRVHMKALQGKIVPRIPEEFQSVYESNGYHYIFMERMQSDLLGKLQEMVDTASNVIPVGSLAVQMVKLVQAIHGVHHLLIDVKPENFMFARPSSAHGARKQERLEERLRVVDLGLMRPFERPEKRSGLAGNAMYASLHMHSLQNSSRRDDLEMVCYVLGDILIRVWAIVQGTADTYQTTSIPSFLPWSQEQSDEELYEVKQIHVEDPNSEFYRRMPLQAANTLYECLQTIWSYKFNTAPDYAGISNKLGNLSVPLATTKTPPTKSSGAKRKTRTPTGQENEVINLLDDNEIRVPNSLPKKTPSKTIGTQTEETCLSPDNHRHADDCSKKRRIHPVSSQDPTDMEVDEVFHDSVHSVQEELELSRQDEKQKTLGIEIVVETPNLPSTKYVLMENESAFLGCKPSKKPGILIEVPGSLEANHVQLTLCVRRQRVLHVVVKDLNSQQGTDVGKKDVISRKPVKKGGETACMIPGQIYLGRSVVQVRRL